MSIRTVVRLPNMNALETASLATDMLAAAGTEAASAKNNQLPASLEPARQRLVTSLAILVAARLQPGAADANTQQHADDVIDNAWGAFHDWLVAWTRVPLASQAFANQLYELLFHNGLGFLSSPYKVEHKQSAARLRALGPDHEALIHSLGGAPLLAHLREAHAAYGVALGISETKAAPSKTRAKSELNACRAALRDYIAKVLAYEDPDVEGSTELAAALIQPLVDWQNANQQRATTTPAPAPESTPAKS
jgi:hypothetical protein